MEYYKVTGRNVNNIRVNNRLFTKDFHRGIESQNTLLFTGE